VAYADEVLADSPLGYWKLDQASGVSCADSSGNSRNLTYQGTPHYQESGPILTDSPSYGVRFDGVNHENVWTNYAAWMLPSSFTLECWLKHTVDTSGGQVVFGVSGAISYAPGNLFVIYIQDTRIKARFSTSTPQTITLQSGTGQNTGEWLHVVFAHDSATTGDNVLYINSVAVDSTTFYGTPASQSRPIRIAGPSDDVTHCLNGTVAHCAFYGTALSAARVAAHFAAAVGGAMAGDASAIAGAAADLTVISGALEAEASSTAFATGNIAMAQSLVADAVARAAATGSIPTPGPGFGAWAREMRPFVRYGRSMMFGYRPYYDDAGALAGAAQSVATASGDLGLTVIGLAGDAVVRVAVVGDLTTGAIVAEQMSGSAQVNITATGDLQTNEIQGSAPVVATATGQLRMTVPLSAEAVARAIAAGTPSVLVPIGGAAIVVEAATGAMLAQSGLAGSAADVASASAAMVAAMAASGSAASRAAAVASLMVGSSLAGQAAAVGTVTGALGVGMDLDADAQARASASATTGISTDLSGQARVTAEATGTLRDIAAVTGGITYAVNLSTGAATNLLNFDFERLVTAHGGMLYGMKAGALYAVGGDADPGAATIAATVRFAPLAGGNIGQKRLETVYLYTRELDGLTVTPIYDEATGVAYTTIPLNRDGMRASRAHVGRGNAWHTLGMVVANRDGGKLDVGGIEPIVSNLSRKRR
jgi:hypothetical protein